MSTLKEFFSAIIIMICTLSYCILLLPDPEVELWLKVVAGIPVFGSMFFYLIWIYQKINAED